MGMTEKPHMSLSARKTEGLAYFLAFMACIPAANWMIGHLGTTCVPDGPCLVPVFPWSSQGGPMMAPSGVSMIGIALVLRDLVQRRLGRVAALMAIVAGAALSRALAPPQLVLAVLASAVVGLIANSILFLYLAFGSLEFLEGQVLGKTWMVLLALPFVHWIRKREGVGAVAS